MIDHGGRLDPDKSVKQENIPPRPSNGSRYNAPSGNRPQSTPMLRSEEEILRERANRPPIEDANGPARERQAGRVGTRNRPPVASSRPFLTRDHSGNGSGADDDEETLATGRMGELKVCRPSYV